MHIDDSACNLASINLMKFLDEDGTFLVDDFRHAVRVVLTAQEIVVTPASYPTKRIGDNARAYRQLGLGYTNLGSLLMCQGVAYDSDDGRAWAGAITALMQGEAYAQSARLAARVGRLRRLRGATRRPRTGSCGCTATPPSTCPRDAARAELRRRCARPPPRPSTTPWRSGSPRGRSAPRATATPR